VTIFAEQKKESGVRSQESGVPIRTLTRAWNSEFGTLDRRSFVSRSHLSATECRWAARPKSMGTIDPTIDPSGRRPKPFVVIFRLLNPDS
jgi:hypothetical protein